MVTEKPVCYVIAGPNGAGKTTFAMKYMPLANRILLFDNSCEKARMVLDVENTVTRIVDKALYFAIQKQLQEGSNEKDGIE